MNYFDLFFCSFFKFFGTKKNKFLSLSVRDTNRSGQGWCYKTIFGSDNMHGRLGQCDQIGQFLKILGGKFAYNIRPNICWIFGIFLQKHDFSSITSLGNRWGRGIGLLSSLTYGHTGAALILIYLIRN